MKKIILSLSVVCLASVAVSAQAKHHPAMKHTASATTTTTQAATNAPAEVRTTAPQTTTTTSSLTADNLVFGTDNHDFGNLAEGGAADYVFQFKNSGKEPILIQKVQASCGCTTPDWSKDPILPGKTGMVKASYGTQGRPGPFTKTLTVMSNAGTKVLTIKGNVEKAPSTSVPENSSMIRTN